MRGDSLDEMLIDKKYVKNPTIPWSTPKGLTNKIINRRLKYYTQVDSEYFQCYYQISPRASNEITVLFESTKANH